jgi:Mn-dependent DtxR family transcriptional regulator
MRNSRTRRFGIVDHDVVTDPNLSLQAKGVYAVISTFCNTNRTCYPSIATIADLCDVSTRTVDRKLKELKDKGYLHRNGKIIKLL